MVQRRSQQATTPSAADAAAAPICRRTPKWAIVLACVHLTAITLAVLQPIGLPDTLQRVLVWVQPYLRAAHFSTEATPIHLPAGEIDEAEVRLQWTEQGNPDGASWQDLEWPLSDWPLGKGLAVSDRRQVFLASAVVLAEAEQYGLVAKWLMPTMDRLPEAKFIRLVRIPTLLSTAVDDAAPAPFLARVIRTVNAAGDMEVRLIHLPEKRLVAIAVDPIADQPKIKAASQSDPTDTNAPQSVFSAPTNESKADVGDGS